MKHVTAFLLLAIYGQFQAQAQSQLPPVPASACDQVNLRLDMAAVHMERAADFRELATWVACTGALFVAADRINNRDTDGRFALGIASFTMAAYVGINGVAVRHDRKASRLLHAQ